MAEELWREIVLLRWPSAGAAKGALAQSHTNWIARYYLLINSFSTHYELRTVPPGRTQPLSEYILGKYRFFIELSTVDFHDGGATVRQYEVLESYTPVYVFNDANNMVRFCFDESTPGSESWLETYGNKPHSFQIYIQKRRGSNKKKSYSFAHVMDISFQAALPWRENMDESAGTINELLSVAIPQWAGAWAIPCVVSVAQRGGLAGDAPSTIISFNEPTESDTAVFAPVPKFVNMAHFLRIIEHPTLLRWVHSEL